MRDEIFVIGGIRESERSIAVDVIDPSGAVIRLRMTKKLWEKYAFSSGDTVGGEVFENMSVDSERCAALTKALSYITDSAHSYKAVSSKLKRHGFSSDAIEHSLGVIHKRGLIDEETQAADIAEKMAKSKLRGPLRIKAELQAKGYSSKIAEMAVRSVPDAVYKNALRTALQKKLRSYNIDSRAQRDKLVASLVRCGFTMGSIFEQLGTQYNDSDDSTD